MGVPRYKGDNGWFTDRHPFLINDVAIRCTAAEAQVMNDAQQALAYARDDKATATSFDERLSAELAEQTAMADAATWWADVARSEPSC